MKGLIMAQMEEHLKAHLLFVIREVVKGQSEISRKQSDTVCKKDPIPDRPLDWGRVFPNGLRRPNPWSPQPQPLV